MIVRIRGMASPIGNWPPPQREQRATTAEPHLFDDGLLPITWQDFVPGRIGTAPTTRRDVPASI
jgi:hypothetical protein